MSHSISKGGKRNAESTAQTDPKQSEDSKSPGMHLPKWPNNDRPEWGCKEGQKTEKKTQETRQRLQEEDGEATETEPACDAHLSFTPVQAPSAPQTPGPGPHAWEIRTRKWAWALGGWASGCQSGRALTFSCTFLRWSSYPWGLKLSSLHLFSKLPWDHNTSSKRKGTVPMGGRGNLGCPVHVLLRWPWVPSTWEFPEAGEAFHVNG